MPMDTNGTMSPMVVGDVQKFGDRIGLVCPPFLNLLLVFSFDVETDTFAKLCLRYPRFEESIYVK